MEACILVRICNSRNELLKWFIRYGWSNNVDGFEDNPIFSPSLPIRALPATCMTYHITSLLFAIYLLPFHNPSPIPLCDNLPVHNFTMESKDTYLFGTVRYLPPTSPAIN